MLHIASDVTHFIKQRSGIGITIINLSPYVIFFPLWISNIFTNAFMREHSAGASVWSHTFLAFWYLTYFFPIFPFEAGLCVWFPFTFSLLSLRLSVWVFLFVARYRYQWKFLYDIYTVHHRSKIIMGNSVRIWPFPFALLFFSVFHGIFFLTICSNRLLINMHDCCFSNG